MNRRSLRNWEFKLGLTQAVALVGVMLGSLACAFYLGFFSGRSAGVQLALNNSASDLVRFPMPADQTEDSGVAKEQTTAEVYAKLNQTGGFGNEPAVAAGAKPADLAPIKNSDAAPLIDELMVEDSGKPAAKNAATARPDPLADIEKSAVAPAGGKLLRDEIAPLSAGQPEAPKALTAPKAEPPAEKLSTEPAAPKAAAQTHEIPSKAVREPAHSALIVAKGNVAKENVTAPAAKIEKKEPVKTAPASGSFVRKVVPKGWYAQVAAPGKLEDANSIAQKIHQAGFPVMIENADVRGQQYFRVIVGPEDNRQLAELLVCQLKREKSVHSEPFIKAVK